MIVTPVVRVLQQQCACSAECSRQPAECSRPRRGGTVLLHTAVYILYCKIPVLPVTYRYSVHTASAQQHHGAGGAAASAGGGEKERENVHPTAELYTQKYHTNVYDKMYFIIYISMIYHITVAFLARH